MQSILITIIVCFLAGMGAGLGTGFAGMSAAAVITPVLVTFLKMDAYQAVGIALASDVLASAISAWEYGKNKNLDIRNGLVMMVSVLVFTMVGSWVSSLLDNQVMGGASVFMTMLLGVKFIVRPVMTTKESMQAVSAGKFMGEPAGKLGKQTHVGHPADSRRSRRLCALRYEQRHPAFQPPNGLPLYLPRGRPRHQLSGQPGSVSEARRGILRKSSDIRRDYHGSTAK